MKIIVLGADGFCGWPTSLHLSVMGHEVLLVDNLSRRKIDTELGIESLTPIASPEVRLQAWKEISGNEMSFVVLDIAEEYSRFLELLCQFQPDAMVHFAEQRAAPYSMKSSRHKRYTVNNNLNATHNVLAAIVESGLDIHLVHLGTMGVYGYAFTGAKIPEGYLRVEVGTEGGKVQQDILHPMNPGSIYHMTKAQDQLLFAFYNKNDRLRITDLHQGIVWGTQTDQTKLDDRLINRFDYDGDYGTVLNRFLMQAVIGHPLTVHGSGGQSRAFIHLQDTVQCIHLAIVNPPQLGERVHIFNQVTEVHRVKDLAAIVSTLTGSMVSFIPNPRKEPAENDLSVENQGLLSLGLTPTTLSNSLLEEIMEIARKYSGRCDPSKILCTSSWTRPHA